MVHDDPIARRAGAWRAVAEGLVLAWALGLMGYYYYTRGFLTLVRELAGGGV
ncbi:MAG: hypothetical protein AB1505_31545 [Candidatus Latescibacterota bacterium]